MALSFVFPLYFSLKTGKISSQKRFQNCVISQKFLCFDIFGRRKIGQNWQKSQKLFTKSQIQKIFVYELTCKKAFKMGLF